MMRTLFPCCLLLFIGALIYPSCQREPVYIYPDIIPVDTIDNPVDTIDNPVDTSFSGVPCSSDTVYFQNEILPLLVSNCTKSGCHNAVDHQNDVVLDSYANIVATVENVTSNDWSENELIKVLVLNTPAERMPPAPNTALSLQQIERITKWVAQGAANNGCSEQTGNVCDTTGITYTNFVKPLIQGKCQGCHSGTNPQGNLNLTQYPNVQSVALNGKLYAAITRTSGWMPKNGQKLNDCNLQKIDAWIKAGAKE
jgi:cytochrome c553